jgi:hypothetical protein
MDDAAQSSYSVRSSAGRIHPDQASPIVRRKLFFALALCPVLMASTCIEPVYVGVDPGPRPGDAPAFQFVYRREPLTYVEGFQVTACGERGGASSTWRIVRDGQTPPDNGPLRLTYGQVPRGYRETTAAQPLRPGGCYDASVEVLPPIGGRIRTPAGSERFRVLPNGQLVVGYSGGLIHNTRPFRQLNRASVGCTRGWRRARTAADSAAVDAREYPVLDARVSCDWLFTEWRDVVGEPRSTERAGLGVAALLVLFVGLGLLSEQIPEWPQ